MLNMYKNLAFNGQMSSNTNAEHKVVSMQMKYLYQCSTNPLRPNLFTCSIDGSVNAEGLNDCH